MPVQIMAGDGNMGWIALAAAGTVTPSFVLGTTKPDASNTGTGIIAAAPTAVLAGNQTITTAGTVLENKIITGQVVIKAANVTIRNCIIKSGTSVPLGSWLVLVLDAAATNARIEYCEIHAADHPELALNGIGSKNFTAYRNHIHDVVDGTSIYNTASGATGVALQGNYIHGMQWVSPDPTGQHSDGTHDDGTQMQGGTGTSIVGNNIMGVESATSTAGYDGYATSALMVNHNVGDPTAATITDNWLGGGGYAINGLGSYAGLNMQILRNRFDTASSLYGPVGYKVGTGNTWNVPTSGADANVDLNGNPISVYTVA